MNTFKAFSITQHLKLFVTLAPSKFSSWLKNSWHVAHDYDAQQMIQLIPTDQPGLGGHVDA